METLKYCVLLTIPQHFSSWWVSGSWNACHFPRYANCEFWRNNVFNKVDFSPTLPAIWDFSRHVLSREGFKATRSVWRAWLAESMVRDASCHHVLSLPAFAVLLKHRFRSWNMVTLFLGIVPLGWREASLYSWRECVTRGLCCPSNFCWTQCTIQPSQRQFSAWLGGS